MTYEKMLEIFRETVKKADMEDSVSVGHFKNEYADIMVSQCIDKPEYLAIQGKDLIPVTAIRNILFSYGEDKYYYHYGLTTLQFIIVLPNDAQLLLEFGECGPGIVVCLNEEEVSDEKPNDFKSALVKINESIALPVEQESFFYSLLSCFYYDGGGKDTDQHECEVIREELYRLVDKSENKELLFQLANTALRNYVYEDNDDLDVIRVFKMIKEQGLVDDFKAFIKNDNIDSDGNIPVTGYYMSLIAKGLEILQSL